MNVENKLERNFDYGSFLPLLLFILGVYVCFLFAAQKYSQGVFVMLIAFVTYIVNNLVVKLKEETTQFNQNLEDLGVFISFAVSLIIFGLMFYGNDFFIMLIIFFYAVCQALNIARNSVISIKNSKGWPAPLNGLFFPLTFYVYLFYLQGPGDSIFIAYFILIAMLSVSEYNFLGYDEETKERRFNFRDYGDEMVDKENTKLNDKEIKGWRNEIKLEKEKEEARNKQMKNLKEEEHQEKLRLEKEKKILKEIEEKAIKREEELNKLMAKELKEKEKKDLENKQKEEKQEKKDLSQNQSENVENKKKWYHFSFFNKTKKIEEKKDEVKKKEPEKYDDYEDEYV